jgi:putative ATPase
MLIFAGEDVGLADPNAVGVVTACADAFDRVGLPEGRFHLAEATLYLATAPKSNSTLAFFDALSVVERERESDVPRHLKDGSRDSEGFGHGQGYLYPHAYRDHWVAQQYLPDGLQGRVFFQPGDQGHERGIRDQVARRREAQLAAMVEDPAQSEILTFSPGGQVHDRWLQRTISNAGLRLGHLRDRVLDAARLQRHHIVLDLNAGSGLLTWELVRRVPEGGIWALAYDRQAGEALRQQAEGLPELQRPVVLVAPFTSEGPGLEELPELLALRGEGDGSGRERLRFDAIVGRNALGRLSGKAQTLRLLGNQLQPGGRISLAETVMAQAQRLYDLVDLSSLGEDLRGRVIEAEEGIYADAGDPLVNWLAGDLQSNLEAAGFEGIVVEEESEESQVLISPAAVERWFSEEQDRERPSYAQHLLGRVTVEELAEVRALFQRQLAGQEAAWRTRIASIAGSWAGE